MEVALMETGKAKKVGGRIKEVMESLEAWLMTGALSLRMVKVQ